MQNLCDYVWTRFASPEDLRETRLDAMDLFLVDFDRGKDEGRYLAQGLPDLPFPDHTFDLALSSHFLFLYSGQLSADFHCAAIEEMLRVAKEARVFPLLTLEAQPSPHLASVIEHLDQTRRQYEVKTVDYEFQKGGNRMLRIFSG
ncbi:MAG: hypothetical protein QF473_19620 [Planctomycetota bacterium]|nr:hypothetical protein [Planctomycetota bacterium]